MIDIYQAQDLCDAVIMHLGADWTWGEFYAAITDAHIMIEALSPRTITFLVRYESAVPVGNTMLHFRNAFRTGPDNIREIILVSGPNNMILGLFETTWRAYNQCIKLKRSHALTLVDSYDDALAYIMARSA